MQSFFITIILQDSFYDALNSPPAFAKGSHYEGHTIPYIVSVNKI